MSLAQNAISDFRLARQAKSLRWFLMTLLNAKSQVDVRPFNTPITVRTSSPDLKVALSCLGGEFEALCSAVPALEHNVIIDAGGYIGAAAIFFAQKYPEAKVVTLEPSKENYAMLVRNTRKWCNIIPLNAALAAEPGQLTLHDRGTGQWGFTLVGNAADRPTSVLDTVDCITVDQILRKVGAKGIDLFKIDIEGGEHALLGKNADWIEKTNAICIELHDRIVAGCTDRWNISVSGRKNFKLDGEKYVSLRAG